MSPLHATDPEERFLAFCRERHAVYLRRAQGLPPPWTDDPVLREYRFCCVYRELDRVTCWISENWRSPHSNDPDLWFAMVVARFINWPDTLEYIDFPVPWRPREFLHRMHVLWAKRVKVYTGAYMVRADPETPGEPKFRYQERVVFSPMWSQRKRLRPALSDTLNSYHMLLGQFHGLGSFMAGQVVADMRHTEPLCRAADLMTFAASGPGSRRGLNRVLGYDKNDPWPEDMWRLDLETLRETFNRRWVTFGAGYPALHGQDLQNCLCEFDKWERVRLGEGRPRARFRPTVKERV